MTNVLQFIIEQDISPTHPRTVILLTDGGVSNTEDLVSYVKKSANSTKIFTIGVGNDPSRDLVDGIAKYTRSKSAYISNMNMISNVVMTQMNRCLVSYFECIEMNWSNATPVKYTNGATIECSEIQPFLFANDVNTIYTIFTTREGELWLSDIQLEILLVNPFGEKSHFPISFTHATLSNDKSITALVSHQMVSYLSKKGTDQAKDAIVQIATNANILSKFTNFVGVEKRTNVNSTDTLEQHHIVSSHRLSEYSLLQSSQMALGATRGGSINKYAYKSRKMDFEEECEFEMSSKRFFDQTTSPVTPKKNTHNPLNKLDDILALQEWDGNWKYSDQLGKLLSVQEKTILDYFGITKLTDEYTTVYVLYHLTSIYDNQRTTWKLIYDKSVRWLSQFDHIKSFIIKLNNK